MMDWRETSLLCFKVKSTILQAAHYEIVDVIFQTWLQINQRKAEEVLQINTKKGILTPEDSVEIVFK